MKSKTGFLQSKFLATIISEKKGGEVHLSQQFKLHNILAHDLNKERKKRRNVQINTAYKQKADKIKSVDLGVSTREKPEFDLNWFKKLWAEQMEHPE